MVSTEETVPMIVKYMMTSRLSESGSPAARILEVARARPPTKNKGVCAKYSG
jgi:hypothetical protein